MRRLQEDTEYRFQELGGKGRRGPPQAGRQPRRSPLRRPARPRRASAATRSIPTQNPNAPGVPQPLGAGAGSAAPAPTPDAPPLGAPGGRSAGAPLDLATLAPPAPGRRSAGRAAAQSESRSPRAAVAHTRRTSSTSPMATWCARTMRWPRSSFRAFLQKYPDDRLAPEANYWLGESLFQRQRYRDAAEAFLNVSTKYETAAKAPDALFRLGQSLAALGEKEAACASLGEVLRKFPRASASVKQGVEREQKRVRC